MIIIQFYIIVIFISIFPDPQEAPEGTVAPTL